MKRRRHGVAVDRGGEVAMIRILCAAIAVLAVLAFGGSSAQAYGKHPWCAVTNDTGDMNWDCEYDSIETCRPHVLAGNRGWCNENPYYKGPAKRPPPPRHRRYRR
jgi:hypothetical protein